ncbi:unnamed protein product, partial [Polarella glacialis]
SAPSASDPTLKAIREFMKKWDLETRFEPKILSYISRRDVPWQDELSHLEKELDASGVPPVCRSGFLLVLFGDVSEKSTDEDFRYLLTGKKGEAADERDDSPSPQRGGKGGGGGGRGKDGGGNGDR